MRQAVSGIVERSFDLSPREKPEAYLEIVQKIKVAYEARLDEQVQAQRAFLERIQSGELQGLVAQQATQSGA